MPLSPRMASPHLAGLIAIPVLIGGAAAMLWWTGDDDRMDAQGGGFLRDGEAGFVVTQFAYATGPDASETGSCPDGMSKNLMEIFSETPEAQRRGGEDDEAFSERLEAGGRALASASDGRNYCAFPELADFDPHARRLLDPDVTAQGIDLDGEDSRTAQDRQSGRLDFSSADGRTGIDNQFWRAVGCNRSYQSDGSSNVYDIGMYAGEWGMVITLGGVDDLQNDDHVDVGIHANADPLRLSPSRDALEFATYAMDPDPAFRATTTGRIVDGELITDPVDVQFHSVVNSIYLVRPLNDARIRAQVTQDGVIEGILGGFAPVEDMYDYQFAYRNGLNAEGELADERLRYISSNGAARVLGHTCQGIWQSLHALADGHPDEQGSFTSISTQYRFQARPAFIVEPEGRNAAGDDDA